MRLIGCAFLSAMLTSAAVLPAAAQSTVPSDQTTPVRLKPEELRALAVQALLNGQPKLAFDLAGALIQRNPEDVDALLLRSRAARDIGNNQAAKTAARDAWKYANSDRDRYAAALANAQALSSDGSRTRAQWWLRRALQIAPTPELRAKAERDFRYVREQNPWSTQLSFSVSPSSNVNGGSSSDTVSIYDLPFDFVLQGSARALSGVEYSYGLSTRYTLRKTKQTRTSLSFAASHKTYSLSEEAKDIAPDTKGSDFALTQLSAGLSQDWFAANGRLALNGQIGVNKAWYGGEPLSQSATASTGLRYAITPKLAASLTVNHEWQEGLGERQDADLLRSSASLSYVIPGGHGLQLGVGQASSQSDATYLDFEERSAFVAFAWGKPVFGTKVQLAVDAKHRHFDATTVSFGDRDDYTYGAEVNFTVNALDYYGFVPTVKIRTEETDSNLAIYDRDNLGLQLGLKSRF
ncbi:MAG: surface lipoprotein assembly modifier [Pseudomonadota bacterium]|nr:surface lipoprotein assembly modifier [Pseudomonadota bacterium]MEC8580587.1 surface lipoprotein assembly modifier [Pseudomonadota bacterium]